MRNSIRKMNLEFIKLNLVDKIIDLSRSVESTRYRSKGMFPSEALALSVLSQELKLDEIFESGMASGYSTEIMAKTLGIPIKSCDLAGYGAFRFWATRLRLSRYPNVSVFRGNSKILLPKLIKTTLDQSRIGVVIDGPKDTAALDLVRELLGASDRIKLIAIHDVGRGRSSGFFELLDECGFAGFVTDEDWFSSPSRHIDELIIGKSGVPRALVKYRTGPGLGLGWRD